MLMPGVAIIARPFCQDPPNHPFHIGREYLRAIIQNPPVTRKQGPIRPAMAIIGKHDMHPAIVHFL